MRHPFLQILMSSFILFEKYILILMKLMILLMLNNILLGKMVNYLMLFLPMKERIGPRLHMYIFKKGRWIHVT
ncbi:hypothetical protein B5F27_13485 [Faecalibacterium sp. An192]|nr:hypothetical protein B5F27_13485 [Faecalibacterium sp. An192]